MERVQADMTLPTELIQEILSYLIADKALQPRESTSSSNVEALKVSSESETVQTLKLLKLASMVSWAWRRAAWPMICARSVLTLYTADKYNAVSMSPLDTFACVKKVIMSDGWVVHDGSNGCYGDVLQVLSQCASLRECKIYKDSTYPWKRDYDLPEVTVLDMPPMLTSLHLVLESGQPLSRICDLIKLTPRLESLALDFEAMCNYREGDESELPANLDHLRSLTIRVHRAQLSTQFLSKLLTVETMERIRKIEIDDPCIVYANNTVSTALAKGVKEIKLSRDYRGAHELYVTDLAPYACLEHLDIVAFGPYSGFTLDMLLNEAPAALSVVKFAADPGDVFDVDVPLNDELLAGKSLKTIELNYYVTDARFDDQQFVELCRPLVDDLARHNVQLVLKKKIGQDYDDGDDGP